MQLEFSQGVGAGRQCTPMSTEPASPASVQALFPPLYRELRRLARSRLAAGGRHTLMDTSTLVHEAYLRMQRNPSLRLNGKEHFLAYAATTMRSVVIDMIRRRKALQRGGDVEHVQLDTQAANELGATADDDVLHVHEALHTLAQVDARLVRVVEMRYFAGLTDLEIAAALGVTDRTVRRDWERARLLLAEMLGR
jgi:RNA polymerase sigma factor (TIGR02999 family)